ncbi:MAG TPA: alpha-xylosidase [Clostridia bacterium]|nr:alpha-xylosidase [Clostridia bacterium]
MKFTKGYWLMREDLDAYFPVHLHDLEMDEDSITAFAPPRPVEDRGDTLNCKLLTAKFSSPMEDVIRVRFYNFKGGTAKTPEFEIFERDDTRVEISEDEDYASLTSGRLKVRINKRGRWGVDFIGDGKVITRSEDKAMGYIETHDGDTYVHEQLSLGVRENVYGLGERFTAFVKNGQTVDIWNEDGGTSSEIAYKNVPFYMTNKGYGVFVNHPEKVSFEIGSEKVSRVQFSVPGQYIEYFLIYGPEPKSILDKYTQLTGRPALPPAWSYGLWLTTSFTTSYDEDTVNSFIDGMAERDIPLHVFHFDCFWMKEFHWCNFEWDERVFPDPEAMLKRLKARGLKICLWINPYIAQRSKLFDIGKEKGYLLKRPNGDVWQWDLWQAGMAVVDFTNPEAYEWYKSELRRLIDMGVDSFKTDFGERIPTDVVYHDGSDPERMHNYYPQIYNKAVFEVLEEKLGEGEACLFARSATAGGQQFPVHWGGDCSANYESMAESLRGGLSLGMSGFGFWSHDIGGFEHTATADVYKRWCAFGLLSSHSRLHGSTSYRVPWLFDEEAVDVLRYFTKLKSTLMPYLYSASCEAVEKGTPVMRSMHLEFPEDPTCDYLDLQYMLGDSLLVAPVFSEEGKASYYLPRGNWTHFIDGRVMEGGQWIEEDYGYMSLPLWVRPGSVIPVGSNDERPDYDYSRDISFHLFEMEDGDIIRVMVPDLDGSAGLNAAAYREGDEIRVEVDNPEKPWNVLLRNIDSVASVEGGTMRETDEGLLITANRESSTVKIAL